MKDFDEASQGSARDHNRNIPTARNGPSRSLVVYQYTGCEVEAQVQRYPTLLRNNHALSKYQATQTII